MRFDFCLSTLSFPSQCSPLPSALACPVVPLALRRRGQALCADTWRLPLLLRSVVTRAFYFGHSTFSSSACREIRIERFLKKLYPQQTC
jgi:hypothetical protein